MAAYFVIIRRFLVATRESDPSASSGAKHPLVQSRLLLARQLAGAQGFAS